MSRRAETIEKLKSQLDDLNERLDRLEARSQQISAELKQKSEQHLAQLRQRRDVIMAKLAEIEAAGKDAWESITREFEVARAALDAGIEEFRSFYDEPEQEQSGE